MFDGFWSDSSEPRSSIGVIGTNTITSTKDAVIKANEIRDLLQEVNIDLGELILDWETFRERYGDSMLTKAFPNASHLIEIYLFGIESSAKE